MKEASARAWRTDPTGLELRVRVTPRSGREGVEGMMATASGMALCVRVRAAPQDGEANRAVERAVADWLGVARSAVALASGARSRVKTVRVAGEPARLAARLEARIGGSL